MIVVVGGKNDSFHFMDEFKQRFYHEGDPLSWYYNELCGHKYLLDHFEEYRHEPYLGVEHYRRAFDLSPVDIMSLLRENDIIVKAEHGPYGELSNRDVLGGCSRYGINYLPLADLWLSRWPELREQADRKTHYGCSMFITTPERFREMMAEEFSYIDMMLKSSNLTRASIGYFCETILTPHIIRKHNKKIHIAEVTCA